MLRHAPTMSRRHDSEQLQMQFATVPPEFHRIARRCWRIDNPTWAARMMRASQIPTRHPEAAT